MNPISRLWELTLERFHLKEFLEHPVPRYANLNPLYWLGDVAAMSFVILAITGTVLAVLYTPGVTPTYTIETPGGSAEVSQSYYSVYKIAYLTPLGFILREIHLWAAYMMVFAAITHFFAKFVLGSYKRKGGGALWLLGVLLGVLTVAQAVLGYILPLHLDGALALQIGLNIFRYLEYFGVPVGQVVVSMMGSTFITNGIMKDIYALHVLVVPATILVLLGLKINGILYGGVSPPPTKNNAARQRALAETEPFYPHRFALTVGQLLLQLSVLLLLVAVFPQPFLEPWLPGQPVPSGVRPPWPVEWYYTYVKVLNPFISVGIPIFMVLFALIVPLIDRKGGNSLEEQWVWVLIAILYMAIIGYGTVLGFLIDIPKPLTPLTRITPPPDYVVPYIGTPTPVG
ncbi:MAG: cytochrome b N-terminal domain-containing protein [Thermoproteus sp.]